MAFNTPKKYNFEVPADIPRSARRPRKIICDSSSDDTDGEVNLSAPSISQNQTSERTGTRDENGTVTIDSSPPTSDDDELIPKPVMKSRRERITVSPETTLLSNKYREER